MSEEISKLNLRLPVQLREDAANVAAAMSQSLNGFIVEAVKSAVEYHAQRLVRRHQQSRREFFDVSEPPAQSQVQREVASVPKVGANHPCPCGSGQKYKRCHGRP